MPKVKEALDKKIKAWEKHLDAVKNKGQTASQIPKPSNDKNNK